MNQAMRSPLANWRGSLRPRFRRNSLFGLCIHTSGRGIVARAARKGVEPIDLALKWYRRRGSVHYVIDYDGTIYQLLEDDRRGAHVGISRRERRRYLSGAWVRDVPAEALRLWRKRWSGWPRVRSPQHLYPGKSPNGAYVAVEMLPLRAKGPDGLWFTPAQHEAAQALWDDLKARHGWVYNPLRLVGHEDLDAYARWDAHGGWDPGALRGRPRFRMPEL